MAVVGSEEYVVGEAARAKVDAQKAWDRQNPRSGFKDRLSLLEYALERAKVNLKEATAPGDVVRFTEEIARIQERLYSLKSGNAKQVDKPVASVPNPHPPGERRG